MTSIRGTIILSLCAVAAAALVFTLIRFSPLTVVIYAKTLEKSTRHIVAEEAESNRQVRIPFEIGSDGGESCVYTIELPRRKWKSVTVPPLAAPGRYEIEKITIENREVRYAWDGSLACTSQPAAGSVLRSAPCAPDAPAVAIGADSSFTISRLSDRCLENSIQLRGVAAMAAALVALLAGFWLCRSFGEQVREQRRAEFAARCAWLLVLLLYCYQLGMLWVYSVDLPFWEEWEFFEPAALQRGLTLEWLFCHFGTNQQVVVFTKLMAWLDFKLFSLDFVKLKLMNYLVFGLFLAAVARFARQVSGQGFRLFPFFMLFLVSPLAYEAHAASFQSGEVFVLLFTMAMLCFFLSERPGYRDTLVFSLFSLGAVFSMHTGVAVASLLLAARTVYVSVRVARKELEQREASVNLLLSWLITCSGIVYWLSGYRKPSSGAPPWLLPTEGKFWDQFFNLLAFGFGFDTPTPFPGIVILLLLLAPVVLLLANKASRWQRSTWQVAPAIIALLALTAMITLGRGNMDGSIKLSRYTVYISPLIPFGSLAWWLLLRGRREALAALAAFWIFCFAAFSDNWSHAIYRDLRQMDLMNIECVARYSQGTGDGACPGTHGVPIGGFFDNARKMNINFTRKFVPPPQPK